MPRILVYADWDGLGAPALLGHLHGRISGSGGEVFEFEYDASALNHPLIGLAQLDPDIGLFGGKQYPRKGHPTFGMFADASPDRWGRLIMQRRLEQLKRRSEVEKTMRLHESHYLLGVHDAFRSGALRLKLDADGPFLDNQHGVAAPPFVYLRTLEAAARALENDEEGEDVDEWLRMLIAPGGSLGGARPKASVSKDDGSLWIAKLPSTRDDRDVGAWELIVQSMADRCGLDVPDAEVNQYASEYHTYLVKRFDRTAAGGRLHFASAMTLTGRTDGDDASTGASYLELADVLIRHGAQTNRDLHELWSRIVFNMLVSNVDDHLRNHGFILEPGRGWRLSKAYDMNPDPEGGGLKLNVSAADNAQDLDLARSVADYFRVPPAQADKTIASFQAIVRQWPVLAKALQIPRREQERMARAFRLAG